MASARLMIRRREGRAPAGRPCRPPLCSEPAASSASPGTPPGQHGAGLLSGRVPEPTAHARACAPAAAAAALSRLEGILALEGFGKSHAGLVPPSSEKPRFRKNA